MQVWTASAKGEHILRQSVPVAHMGQSGIMVRIGVSEELISTLDVALVVEHLGHVADDGFVFLSRHGSLHIVDDVWSVPDRMPSSVCPARAIDQAKRGRITGKIGSGPCCWARDRDARAVL